MSHRRTPYDCKSLQRSLSATRSCHKSKSRSCHTKNCKTRTCCRSRSCKKKFAVNDILRIFEKKGRKCSLDVSRILKDLNRGRCCKSREYDSCSERSYDSRSSCSERSWESRSSCSKSERSHDHCKGKKLWVSKFITIDIAAGFLKEKIILWDCRRGYFVTGPCFDDFTFDKPYVIIAHENNPPKNYYCDDELRHKLNIIVNHVEC
jgi:hypothetical protein